VRLRKDGTLVNVSLTVSPIRDARGELSARLHSRATSRMWSCSATARAQRAIHARGDQRKDEFLATLAHELRNPLAPIRNSSELLRLAGDDPEQRKRALDVSTAKYARWYVSSTT
jgi:signal transduction histidine kinase